MAGVTLARVSKRFGAVAAVDAVDLSVAPGALVALLGPSGCGKTTLLRLVAGFESPDGGRIAIGGEEVASPDRFVPPERRRIGMVFQSYALWPHMTVADNVAYALRIRRVPPADRRTRVEAALAAVGLTGYGARRPAELSGGQRQRVALARCLAMEPRVVLLDEPLANLDVHLRESMQAEFRSFHAATGATMLYVTHDQAEAMALADVIAVMDGGRVEQVAAPADLYHRPATPMVARFVGRGMVVAARPVSAPVSGRVRAVVLGVEALLRCDGAAPSGLACLRPEGLALTRTLDGAIAARVRSLTYNGATTTVRLAPEAAAEPPLSLRVAEDVPEVGSRVGIRILDGWLLPQTPMNSETCCPPCPCPAPGFRARHTLVPQISPERHATENWPA